MTSTRTVQRESAMTPCWSAWVGSFARPAVPESSTAGDVTGSSAAEVDAAPSRSLGFFARRPIMVMFPLPSDVAAATVPVTLDEYPATTTPRLGAGRTFPRVLGP